MTNAKQTCTCPRIHARLTVDVSLHVVWHMKQPINNAQGHAARAHTLPMASHILRLATQAHQHNSSKNMYSKRACKRTSSVRRQGSDLQVYQHTIHSQHRLCKIAAFLAMLHTLAAPAPALQDHAEWPEALALHDRRASQVGHRLAVRAVCVEDLSLPQSRHAVSLQHDESDVAHMAVSHHLRSTTLLKAQPWQGCVKLCIEQVRACDHARTAASESVASFSLQPRTSIITAGTLPVP